MRICHVSPHLPPDQAANALLPALLGEWARSRGDDVRFLTHEPAQEIGRGEIQAGSRFPKRPEKTTPGLNFASPGLSIFRVPRKAPPAGVAGRLARLLRVDTLAQARLINAALGDAARGVDLLHLHSNGLIIEVAAAWASRHNVPYVLTLYGTEIWHYRRRPLVDPFTRAYQRARVVTFYSRKLKERAVALGLSHPRLKVIYPPIADSFRPADAATRAAWRASLGISESHVILNVKRLHELAGQKFLIDAFAHVARERRDVRLVICGTGPLREALEAQARDAGVAGRVTFTGLVPNDVVAQYASVADVFVLPSLLEALPTVAVEALACGTPVISADHPGGVELHDLFGDDVQVVAKSDVDGLRHALAAFLAAPRRVRTATPAIIRDHFGREAIERSYAAAYAAAGSNGGAD